MSSGQKASRLPRQVSTDHNKGQKERKCLSTSRLMASAVPLTVLDGVREEEKFLV